MPISHNQVTQRNAEPVPDGAARTARRIRLAIAGDEIAATRDEAMSFVAAVLLLGLVRERFGFAPAAGNRVANRFSGAAIAQIGLLRTTARVVER